jgi:hypothetical protein
MRLSAFLITASAFTFGTISAQVSTTAQGTVTGHIYCADSRTPCRFATVTIQSVPSTKSSNPASPAQQSHSFGAATDIEGVFQIRGVIPGEYYILSRLPGYLSPYDLATNEFQGDSSLEHRALDIALTRISVEPDQTTTSNLTLSRGASLEGTVRYDDSGVAINATVNIYRRDGAGRWNLYKNRAGISNLAPLGFSPHTDDRGHFYEPGLPPGLYIVEAALPEATTIPTTILSAQALNVSITKGDALRVYSGNKYRLRDAIPIELHEGEDRSNIDINIPTNGLHSLHGLVTARPDDHSITHGTVRLLDADDKTALRETSIQLDGSFAFKYVVNGSYLVQVDGQGNSRETKPASGYESLITPLLVEGDIGNLAYALTALKP